MFRCRSGRCAMRVVCLTMCPGGGAVAVALQRLGYTPYTLRSALQGGRAARHPREWAKFLRGDVRRFDMRLLSDFDAVAGPPAAMCYARLLRECPGYTKVVLAVETDKQRFAREFEAHVAPLLRPADDVPRNNSRRRRGGCSKLAKAFDDMINSMTPFSSAAGVAEVLERYEQDIIANVEESRLLVYRYGDGWEPLCAFLAKDVPQESFPPYDSGVHVVGNLQERIERTEKLTFLLLAVVCFGVVYMLYPLFDFLKAYASGLYRDYKTAYGEKMV